MKKKNFWMSLIKRLNRVSPSSDSWKAPADNFWKNAVDCQFDDENRGTS